MTYDDHRKRLADLKIQLPQNDAEFSQLCDLVQTAAPRVVVEIGTKHGGSLWLLSRYLPEGAVLVSIDLVGAGWGAADSRANKLRVFDQLRADGFEVHSLELDSHQQATKQKLEAILAGRPVDLLFVDGDHTFTGCLKDWKMYRSLVRRNGLVVFHDIQEPAATASDYQKRIKVFYIWRVLKTIFASREFISSTMGIGVIWNEPAQEEHAERRRQIGSTC